MKRKNNPTAAEVADRLEQAAHTLRRLPKVTVRGYFGTWPPIMQEALYAYGWEEARLRPGPPSAIHISEMDETLRWFLWLESHETTLVWLRACGVRWKTISRLSGWSVRKMQYDWRVALVKIAHRLGSPEEHFAYPYRKRIQNG